MKHSSPMHIAIIGAGFAGTAFAAAYQRIATRQSHLHLFEKSGEFGKGAAYCTPFSYHLLNVCAKDMSAFEEEPSHFVTWLQTHSSHSLLKNLLDAALPLEQQFVPRCLYGEYLHDLLKNMQQAFPHSLTLQPHEVVDIAIENNQAVLMMQNQSHLKVDKVVLALGNQLPHAFPFSVDHTVHCIENPWEYEAPHQIEQDDPVLIVGTGLSMIDTVLTLHHQQHRGPIFAVSRHGLLPLPHAKSFSPSSFTHQTLPFPLRSLIKFVRDESKKQNDWRTVVNGLRTYAPQWWKQASVKEKKQFLRHVMPYWNVHRHRVHHALSDLLKQLGEKRQLIILAGQVLHVKHQEACIKLRQSSKNMLVPVKWIINCMGPGSHALQNQPLVTALLKRSLACMDPLNLGLQVNEEGAVLSPTGEASSLLYTLGSLRRGALWEVSAVPEIRKQCFELANIICHDEKEHKETYHENGQEQIA